MEIDLNLRRHYIIGSLSSGDLPTHRGICFSRYVTLESRHCLPQLISISHISSYWMGIIVGQPFYPIGDY